MSRCPDIWSQPSLPGLTCCKTCKDLQDLVWSGRTSQAPGAFECGNNVANSRWSLPPFFQEGRSNPVCPGRAAKAVLVLALAGGAFPDTRVSTPAPRRAISGKTQRQTLTPESMNA